MPSEYDDILLDHEFCEKCIEFFLKYQWNNIYHNKFLEFFWLYLNKESKHKKITDCFFHKIKLQNLYVIF